MSVVLHSVCISIVAHSERVFASCYTLIVFHILQVFFLSQCEILPNGKMQKKRHKTQKSDAKYPATYFLFFAFCKYFCAFRNKCIAALGPLHDATDAPFFVLYLWICFLPSGCGLTYKFTQTPNGVCTITVLPPVFPPLLTGSFEWSLVKCVCMNLSRWN